MLYQNFRPWRGASATVGFDFDSYSGEIPISGGNRGYDMPGFTAMGGFKL